MTALKLSLLLAPLVLADVGARQGNVYLGPVRDIDCKADAGLYCTRDAGEPILRLHCVGATATEAGCVTPGAQTWAGTKTLTGDERIVGHVHASLTACSSGLKGTWQTCTTHSSPVFCNGTSNIELLGSVAAEYELWPIHVDGIPVPFFGATTVSSTSSWTITAVSGFWNPGSGAGSLPLTFLSAAGTCTCTIDCDVPTARTTCSGNCTIAASDTIYGLRGTTTCTLDPAVGGNLAVMGTMP